MNVLITGGSGFVGRHVTRLLLAQGSTVTSFQRHTVSFFEQQNNYHVIQGDLSTGKGLENVPWKNIDTVIHLAAAGVKAAQRVWPETIQGNIVGTQQLLNYIKKRASQKPKVFITKTFYEKGISRFPTLRNNPYIATKEAASQLAECWAQDYQGTTIFGTLFHSFGPDDNASNVLSYAAHQLKAGLPARFSSGKALGDWLYITDTAAGIIAAIEASTQGITHWDIGSGNLTSIRDLIEKLLVISEKKTNLISFDPSLDRPEPLLEEAAQILPPKFQPRLTLQQGLEKLYNHII